MSSLAGKMSALVDEYNHSKTSPAYRKLHIKYKALKASNQELVHLLTHLFSTMNPSNDGRAQSQSKPADYYSSFYSRHNPSPSNASKSNYIEDNFPELDGVNSLDDLFEIRPTTEYGDAEVVSPELPEVHKVEPESDSDEEGEEEEGECDDLEEEEEDPSIKEQIIQEQVAESDSGVFTNESQIHAEETEEVEALRSVEETEEVVALRSVEEVEVEETEEVEEVEETEEVVEVEETEEVEEVEVEETEEVEEVEETEEEEAGVYEVEINGTRYYTTNEKDGVVYAVLEDDDVGDEIGKFVNGKFVLN